VMACMLCSMSIMRSELCGNLDNVPMEGAGEC
jgi:hypothetical protein